MPYLLIEFLDELVFGVGETAWPLIRDDLQLTYSQIGLALSLPGIIAAFIEPFIGILGDVWRRRLLILTGGLLFTVSLLLASASFSFILLLSSFILFNPSSGAFVNLSQANLMDSDESRHEQNMARWTFAGSLGVVTGPLLLGLFVHLGLGWRGTYALLASLSTLSLLLAIRFLPADKKETPFPSFKEVFDGFKAAFAALKRKEIWRWLLLLEFADLMLDVLFSFLALYFVDVAGVTAAQAGIAVTVWLVMGLITDFLFIPYVEKQRDTLQYLRRTALLNAAAFTGFMLAPGFIPKIVCIILVNLFNTGWYPILQGRLYSSLPGQSASVMAIGAVTDPLMKLLPLLIGILADRFGLASAMWILILGPLALLIGLPKRLQPETFNLKPST
ncbi:MFS transporter [Chloroflexi bacterium CFX5]|nr:MFS transporter [Chloroflexi bacterium CFX5]